MMLKLLLLIVYKFFVIAVNNIGRKQVKLLVGGVMCLRVCALPRAQ